MVTTSSRLVIRFDGSLLALDITRRGWTPAELARRAGVADMTVYRFISGKQQSAATAKKLARALRRSIDRYIVVAEAVAS